MTKRGHRYDSTGVVDSALNLIELGMEKTAIDSGGMLAGPFATVALT